MKLLALVAKSINFLKKKKNCFIHYSSFLAPITVPLFFSYLLCRGKSYNVCLVRPSFRLGEAGGKRRNECCKWDRLKVGQYFFQKYH